MSSRVWIITATHVLSQARQAVEPTDSPNDVIDWIAKAFAAEYGAMNQRFDRERFLSDCGVKR